MQTHYGWMIGTVVLVASAVAAHGGPPASVGTVSGKVTYTGTPPKMKPIDMAKEPNCAKEHAAAPVLTENVVTGPGNSLRWVVVYVSAGDQGSTPATETVRLDQKACQYIPHVLVVQPNQPLVQQAIGKLYLDLRDYETAVRFLGDLQKLTPEAAVICAHVRAAPDRRVAPSQVVAESHAGLVGAHREFGV